MKVYCKKFLLQNYYKIYDILVQEFQKMISVITFSLEMFKPLVKGCDIQQVSIFQNTTKQV